ncbi:MULTISPECIES: hypothetical protein [Achromobacter]|uniref:hypothetical protein n=1 Tax=Achromobacter TaxID=222 RepID=UPI0025BF0514|nr:MULTISPECIES: hypothetical protein [Achromobacter]
MDFKGIPKLVASGVIRATPPGRRLRVTLMLSPTMGKDDLPNLPGKLIQSWLDEKWVILLKVAQVRISGGECADSFQAAIAAAVDVEACWSGGAAAWRNAHQRDIAALNQLWADSFRDNCGNVIPDPWDELAALLTASNGGKGLQAGSGLTQKPSPTSPPSPDAATVEAILPSRQSDLALLLESERALETSATVRWARGEFLSCAAEEARCLARIAAPPVLDSQQKLVNDARARYKAAQTAVDDQYRCLADTEGMPQARWLVAPASLDSDRADLTGKIPSAVQSYTDANVPENATTEIRSKQAECARLKQDSIAQCYFAIQGSPALSRLFGLTVDLEIDPEKLEEALRLHGATSDPCMVAHLLLGFPRADPKIPDIWTLARYRPAGAMHFLPGSRLELQMFGDTKKLHPAASQYEGVLVLGQDLNVADDQNVSRFMLTSLDVPRATNGAIDRIVMGTKQSRSAATGDSDVAPPPITRRSSDCARKTHSTAGLVLLDRGRLEQATLQFAARVHHATQIDKQEHVVLDSNDLLIGYRIDVGVPLKPKRGNGTSAAVTWRSLMARNIEHGTFGISARLVREKVHLLMGSGASGKTESWQRTLDDVYLSLPIRIVKPDKGSSAPPGERIAYVEEIVAVWTGEPMAAQCAGDATQKKTNAIVGAGETISLPEARLDSDRVPPPLRFGWPYRVGVRAVYAGGISLPLVDARRLYDAETDCPAECLLTLPSPQENRSGIRRFTRHERISAPYLLLHENIAQPTTPPPLMGYQHAGHAVVRSGLGKIAPDRDHPSETQRIFVPPSVEMHFAAMHGVFDDNTQDREPPDGLRGVDFDAANGGFPFVSSQSVEGVNGQAFNKPRTIRMPASQSSDQRGDAVYRENKKRTPRLGPRRFYPDPAADYWVVAVRFAGTQHYLDGNSVTKPMRGPGMAYPHCRPLTLRIVRNKTPRPQLRLPTLDEVITLASSPSGKWPVTNCIELVVALAPGEDFEVDVWCMPSKKNLADLFATVESIGTLALQQARKGQPRETRIEPPAFLEALRGLLSPDQATIQDMTAVLAHANSLPTATNPQATQGNDGVGGLPAPGRAARMAIAEALYETLSRRPIDEIAAVQTIRTTHATEQPWQMPIFGSKEDQRRPFIFRPQPNIAPMDNSVTNLAGATSTDAFAGHKRDVSVSEPEYILAGDLLVDLPTTGAIEIRANAACPTSATFDDPRRGRSTRDRRNGDWPGQRQSEPLSTREVFGFDVAGDGRVDFPRPDILLLRIEDLVLPSPDVPLPYAEGRWLIALEGLTGVPGPNVWGRVVERYIFPDRKARRLMLHVFARTRHEELMRTASAEARPGGWLRPGQELPRPKDPISLGTPIDVWLPAGIRPSEPIAQTPIPAFVWENRTSYIQRRVLVRIPLDRGWFSSGEGEMLGVVIWPPHSLDGITELSSQTGGQPSLPDFTDEDLGPGGRFVTRWGSDPTKLVDPDAPTDSTLPGFLPPSAFKDLIQQAPLGSFAARLESLVTMPIRVEPATGTANPDIESPTLDVSLVAYEPRFDIETEQWYVDMSIEHPFEAQPFVRLGLVRFQPNAPRKLQVSYPVTQWIQLLPVRSAWLTTEMVEDQLTAHVTVHGLASAQALTCPANELVATRFWAYAMSEYKNDAGLLCRRIMPARPMEEVTIPPDNDASLYAGPCRQWKLAIDITSLLTDNPHPDATHFVYVEEREAYLPATYGREPVDAQVAAAGPGLPEGLHVEGGPRFAVRLPLNLPCTPGNWVNRRPCTIPTPYPS